MARSPSRETARVSTLPFWGGVELLRARFVTQRFSRHFHEGFALGCIEDGAMRFSYRGESVVATSTIISLFGLLWFLPMGIFEAAHTDLAAISPTGWLVVFYYGAFVTVLAYLFWFAGITRVRPSTAGVFTAIMPVAALALSALLLGEPIGWQQLTGCGCVLGGIVLISR